MPPAIAWYTLHSGSMRCRYTVVTVTPRLSQLADEKAAAQKLTCDLCPACSFNESPSVRRRPLYFTTAEQKATRTDKTPPKVLKVSGMSAALRATIASECSLDTVEDYVGVAVCNQCYSRLRKMSKRAAAAAVSEEDHQAIHYTPGNRAKEPGVLTATPSAVLQHLSRLAAARVTQSRVKSAMVVDTAGSGSGDEEPQYVPHPDLYALTRDAPIATVDDVQNLMNMFC